MLRASPGWGCWQWPRACPLPRWRARRRRQRQRPTRSLIWARSGWGKVPGNGLNATGQATGLSDLPSTYTYSCGYPVRTCTAHPYHAFLYSSGKMTDLGTLGGHNSLGKCDQSLGPGGRGPTLSTGSSARPCGPGRELRRGRPGGPGRVDQRRDRDQRLRPGGRRVGHQRQRAALPVQQRHGHRAD